LFCGLCDPDDLRGSPASPGRLARGFPGRALGADQGHRQPHPSRVFSARRRHPVGDHRDRHPCLEDCDGGNACAAHRRERPVSERLRLFSSVRYNFPGRPRQISATSAGKLRFGRRQTIGVGERSPMALRLAHRVEGPPIGFRRLLRIEPKAVVFPFFVRLCPLADMMRTTASLIVYVTKSIRQSTKPIALKRGSSSASRSSNSITTGPRTPWRTQ
jgi:hypothetical protein